jgi:hypothetical protein
MTASIHSLNDYRTARDTARAQAQEQAEALQRTPAFQFAAAYDQDEAFARDWDAYLDTQWERDREPMLNAFEADDSDVDWLRELFESLLIDELITEGGPEQWKAKVRAGWEPQ